MKIRTFCFAAAFGATIFACSGKNSDVTDSTDNASEDLVTAVCAKSACGPELGMPAEICPDGSIGGNTGRCVETKSNAVCHWEIRKCPAPTPTPICDCGPINFLVPACPDGSTRKPICEPLPAPVASSGGGSGGGSAGSGSGSATPGAPPAPGPTPVPDPSPTPGPSPVPPSCGWVVPPCATPPPPVCDCGPKPDYLIKCSDGSVVGPVCEP
ncbi:MAG TPA: hypothetical protein VIF62_38380, partial [Labilithrix sp.]